MSNGWVGFDLDATLAEYSGWNGPDKIGEPIAPMVARVKSLLAAGVEVRIFTARVCSSQAPEDRQAAHAAIRAWCLRHFGHYLTVTSEKDFGMWCLFDDRAVAVEKNTGRVLGMDAETAAGLPS